MSESQKTDDPPPPAFDPVLPTWSEWDARDLEQCFHGLTEREEEILEWIAFGKTNKEIAIILGISRRTVQTHSRNILKKLKVERRSAASAAWCLVRVLRYIKQICPECRLHDFQWLEERRGSR